MKIEFHRPIGLLQSYIGLIRFRSLCFGQGANALSSCTDPILMLCAIAKSTESTSIEAVLIILKFSSSARVTEKRIV